MAIINKTGITNGGTIQAEHITRVIDALSGVSTDTLIVSGSMTGSLIGTLTGTASFATSASRAVTSSFALTASYALNSTQGSGELMTLRLSSGQDPIRSVSDNVPFYVGFNSTSSVIDEVGVLIPYDCTVISASLYINGDGPIGNPAFSISSSLLAKPGSGDPALIEFETISPRNGALIGRSYQVNEQTAGGTYFMNIEVTPDTTSQSNFRIAADILIQKL